MAGEVQAVSDKQKRDLDAELRHHFSHATSLSGFGCFVRKESQVNLAPSES